jgi:hypothetical protein
MRLIFMGLLPVDVTRPEYRGGARLTSGRTGLVRLDAAWSLGLWRDRREAGTYE